MTKKTSQVERPNDIEPLDPNTQPELAPPNEVPQSKLRFGKEDVPASFIRHRGKKDPIGNELALVHLIIKTASGLGFAGPRQVHPTEWAKPQSEDGSIQYYQRTGTAHSHQRMFHRPEPSRFQRMYAEQVTGKRD